MKIEPLKNKYHGLYRDIAIRVAQQSYATRRKVGCVIVSPTGLIAVGFNGMPAGHRNECELPDGSTNPWVTHAERNAIDKMTRQGVPVDGSILFTTLSPCVECAKSIAAVGITTVYYGEEYRDTSGLEFLQYSGVTVKQWSN